MKKLIETNSKIKLMKWQKSIMLTRLISIITLLIIITSNFIDLKADFQPCESEEPISIDCGSVGRMDVMIDGFQCESVDPYDLPCRIEVEYCVRFYMVEGVLVDRVEITGIKLLNCDPNCNQYIWSGALVVMALEKDLRVPWNIYDMIYQAATCWKPKPTGPYSEIQMGYDRCNEGECCVGFYHITRDFDENDNKVITIEFISRLTKMTHYCTPPCTFTDCESSTPGEVLVFTDNGTGVYYPKVSNPESIIESGLFLRPNPVDEKIDIRIVNSTRENIFVRIYDNNGELVHEQSLGSVIGATSFQVNTSGFAAGMYNIVVFNNLDVLYNKSFVKIK